MQLTANDHTTFRTLRDTLYSVSTDLTVYPGVMEMVTATAKTTLTVAETVRKVMSVWLDSDTGYTGTDYYGDPKAENFSDTTIMLSTPLPSDSIDVKVAYYRDCTVCGWDPDEKAAIDSSCAFCDGLGMILPLGDAVEIPIRLLPHGTLTEEMELIGETASGLVAFRCKAEHESLIRASVQMQFMGRNLRDVEDNQGLSMKREFFMGELSEITVYTRYEPL